jgi:hypothetical protein
VCTATYGLPVPMHRCPGIACARQVQIMFLSATNYALYREVALDSEIRQPRNSSNPNGPVDTGHVFHCLYVLGVG